MDSPAHIISWKMQVILFSLIYLEKAVLTFIKCKSDILFHFKFFKKIFNLLFKHCYNFLSTCFPRLFSQSISHLHPYLSLSPSLHYSLPLFLIHTHTHFLWLEYTINLWNTPPSLPIVMIFPQLKWYFSIKYFQSISGRNIHSYLKITLHTTHALYFTTPLLAYTSPPSRIPKPCIRLS